VAAAQLAKVGINVQLKAVSLAAWVATYDGPKTAGFWVIASMPYTRTDDLASGAPGTAACGQRRSIQMTRTMITIRTTVPRPIYMRFSSPRLAPAGAGVPGPATRPGPD